MKASFSFLFARISLLALYLTLVCNSISSGNCLNSQVVEDCAFPLQVRGGANMSYSTLKSALSGAIQKGAPVYNSGRPDLCYQIYKTVATRALNQEMARGTQADLLAQALEEASGQADQRDSDGAAWTMRRAFDMILEDRVLQQQRSSERDATVTEWEILNFEAGLPSAPRWGALDDVVMGGVSRSTVDYNPGDSCLSFYGEVSTARNGGFASVRSEPWAGWDFNGAKGVELLVQGDNRTYKLNIPYSSVVYQKDFVASSQGWQGCMEHAAKVFQAMKDARDHYRSICMSLLDLAGAYPSVRL